MVNFGFTREAHLAFCRMHVHIHRVGWKVDENHALRIPPVPMQQALIGRLHCVLDGAAFDDAAIDVENLPVAIGARQLRARGKAGDDDIGSIQLGRRNNWQHLPRDFAALHAYQ